MDCSLPGFSCPWNFQASILECAATSYSRVSSRPRDRTHVSCVSCSGGCIFYHCVTWEAQLFKKGLLKGGGKKKNSGGLCRHHLGPIRSWALGHSWNNQCSCNIGKSELEDLVGRDPTSLQGVCLRFPRGRILCSVSVRIWENAWVAQVWDFKKELMQRKCSQVVTGITFVSFLYFVIQN